MLDIFHATANAYKENDFEKHMHNLEECAPRVYAKLMDIGQPRTKAQARGNEVSEYVEESLGYAIGKGSFMTVQPASDSRFNIISGQKNNIVDLVKRECSCKAFDTLLLPCSHTAAAIR